MNKIPEITILHSRLSYHRFLPYLLLSARDHANAHAAGRVATASVEIASTAAQTARTDQQWHIKVFGQEVERRASGRTSESAEQLKREEPQ